MIKVKRNIINNILSLYGFSIAKILLPLAILPYLTRVLSVESYGMVSYSKTVIGYMQIIVDFGFILSGTKDIALHQKDKKEVGELTGDILFARLLLVVLLIPIVILLPMLLPILRISRIYFILSFIPVILSVFLFDYVFTGLEKMHVLTIRFFIMKGISTLFTFVVVKSDVDILWIPILEIIGSFIAIILVIKQLKKEDIYIKVTNFKRALSQLKKSSVFFVSNVANTIFGAFNTLIIGVFLNASEVAYWSICIQLVSAVQTMYQPITDGIYPEMVKSKDLRYIKNILLIFMPLIFMGCIFTFVVAKYALFIVGGEKYMEAEMILRCLIPVMFLGFPCVVFGWPTLGAINKENKVTLSTIIAAVFQLLGLCGLVISNRFTLFSIALVRSTTEMVLFVIRFYIFNKYKHCFSNNK